MKRTITAILSIMMLSALVAEASAEPRDRGPHGKFGMPGGFHNPGQMIERMTRHLDLDDAQQQSVQAIVDAAQPEIDALKQRVDANREARKSLSNDDPNRAAAFQNIAMESGQLLTDGMLLADRVRSDVHAVLTDEQREKLAELRSRMGERRDHRRFGRFGHRPDSNDEQAPDSD